MPKKKTTTAPVELAMIRDAAGNIVPRNLPCHIDKIKMALRAKAALGLPVELSQAECRNMKDTVKDLETLLHDPIALETRKGNNARRARFKKQSDQIRRERVRDNVRKYL